MASEPGRVPHLAQARLSAAWRGHAIRRATLTQVAALVAKPSLQVSRQVQRAALPRDHEGKLLPLTASIDCFKVFGSGVYSYMEWQRFMFVTFSLAFAVVLPSMVSNVSGSNLENASWLTKGSLGDVKAAAFNASYGAVELIVLSIFVISLFRGRDIIAAAKDQVDHYDPEEAPEETTVWLRGLPPRIQAAVLQSQLECFGECTQVVLARKDGVLLKRLSARQHLLENLQHLTALLYLSRQAERCRQGSARRELLRPVLELLDRVGQTASADDLLAKEEEARRELAEHDSITARLSRQAYDGTGDAFATFSKAEQARRCIEAIAISSRPHRRARVPRKAKVGIEAPVPSLPTLPSGVTAQRAPAPSDILWEGLATPARERLWRQVVSTTITMLIAGTGTAIIAFITWANDKNGGLLSDALPRDRGGFSGLIMDLLAGLLLQALPCIFGNLILFASTPVLADVLERHPTYSDREASVFAKLLFFQVVNTVASAMIFLSVTGGIFGRSWYSLGGATVATVMGPLGDALVIPTLLDWIGSALPILYLFGALFFSYGMLIDRHNLLRNQCPPPRTFPKLTWRAHTTVSPSSATSA